MDEKGKQKTFIELKKIFYCLLRIEIIIKHTLKQKLLYKKVRKKLNFKLLQKIFSSIELQLTI